MKRLFLLILLIIFSGILIAQNPKKKGILRDSLDNKLDFSDFLLNPKGFIPFLKPVTEPALGGIGVMGGPIFINPNKHPYTDKYTTPNITAIMGAYTANDTWFVGGAHIGVITKYKFKYSIGGGYGSINMDFYRNLPVLGEREFAFNFRSVPIFGSLLKQFGDSNFYAGIEYVFVSSHVKPEFQYDELPDFIKEKDFKSILSSPALVVEYDGRDNFFSPDKGTFVNINYHFNDSWTGSDYTFGTFEVRALHYLPILHNWISGFRFQMDLQNGDAPFYVHPAVQLRGVPQARYQGDETYLLETEQRYDFTMRWSAVAFGGLAKAVQEQERFSDADYVYNYGAGFRYLIARKFKIRMGIDVAWSNNDFGYYLVFGTAWGQRN